MLIRLSAGKSFGIIGRSFGVDKTWKVATELGRMCVMCYVCFERYDGMVHVEGTCKLARAPMLRYK